MRREYAHKNGCRNSQLLEKPVLGHTEMSHNYLSCSLNVKDLKEHRVIFIFPTSDHRSEVATLQPFTVFLQYCIGVD